ncbi:hypothetical protein SORBI_3008G110000 [Sorghum bicolor]|uniref:DRBM domain-containing protein n=1 Tax=Sorghum bicolor TaxID=4558 RepID=C5YP46_SORBI|nr:hypothetical protein SORBI_3008G110000 [Sorghum bicolor]
MKCAPAIARVCACPDTSGKKWKARRDHVVKESKTDFKTQLSVYAQKLSKVPPLYKHIQEGPAHAPRFNAEVTIDGQTFGRPELLYYKLKDAEAAAAEVALDLLPPIPPQEYTIPSLSYKNFIQEIAQKEGISLPVYNTVPTNKENSTAYKSSVQIKGEIFEGEPGTSKKQAEMNAAKIAYHHLALPELEGDDNERLDH